MCSKGSETKKKPEPVSYTYNTPTPIPTQGTDAPQTLVIYVTPTPVYEPQEEIATAPSPTEEASVFQEEEPTPAVMDAAYTTPTPTAALQQYPVDGEYRVTFIDVGQGDCTLIEDNGAAMLIDAGPRESVGSIEAVLNQHGVQTIDTLILTHNDADHIQGAINIIPDYHVQNIYMTNIERSTGTYYLLTKEINNSNAAVFYPKAGAVIPFGSATYEVVGPALDAYTVYESNNSNSIIVKATHGNDTFLFAADATGEETDDILRAGYDLSAKVLKAAHHGSAADECNSKSFLNAVSPETVVISCGRLNDYGHPHGAILDRIRDKNCKLYRTDLQGTISCTSTGNGIIWDMEPTNDYRDGDQIY